MMRNDKGFHPVCSYCKTTYDPVTDGTDDGIALCGWCRHNRDKIIGKLLTMIAVLNSAYVVGISKLSEEDDARFTTIYHAHQTCPPEKRDVFERKIINTIAQGGKLAIVLTQWQSVREAQAEYERIQTLFEAIP